MPPLIAAALCTAGIVALIYLDRDRKNPPSPAIWLAIVWVFFGASRMPTQWLHTTNGLAGSADQYMEGSPLDRVLLSGVEIAALLVLWSRRRRVSRILRENKVIFLFFAYCLVSIVWSDFPLVALKRWTKALGNLSMVLLVLTDRNALPAVKQFFSRTGVLLIALSVLVIKYYPDYGRGYNGFTWTTFYCGVSTDKNGLGVICLIFGLAILWRMVEVFRDKDEKHRVPLLMLHGVVLGMNLWLLHMANSSTSLGCLVLGSAVLLITARSGRTRTVHILATLIIFCGVFAYAFPEGYDSLVHLLGRNPDLTGRTDIWNDVLNIPFNPFVGTGFESFWLGERADYFWNRYYFHPNQAHNGYIETYLNLGWIGVMLLAAQFLVGYGNIVAAFRRRIPIAPFRFSLLVVATLYNMTEAAFKVMHPMWIAFLFAVIAVPDLGIRRKQRAAISKGPASAELSHAELVDAGLMATSPGMIQ
jgi:exopolysaccharide production protein ExoQ